MLSLYPMLFSFQYEFVMFFFHLSLLERSETTDNQSSHEMDSFAEMMNRTASESKHTNNPESPSTSVHASSRSGSEINTGPVLDYGEVIEYVDYHGGLYNYYADCFLCFYVYHTYIYILYVTIVYYIIIVLVLGGGWLLYKIKTINCFFFKIV